MLDKLTVNKSYLLIAGTIILSFASYQLAFKSTIAAWQIHRTLEAQLTAGSNLDLQPDYLIRKRNNLAKLISSYKSDTVLFRSNIINKIALMAENDNVKLSGVPVRDEQYSTDQFVVEKLSFVGGYNGLLQLLHTLEITPDIGFLRSASVHREIRMDIPVQNKLVMDVYLAIVK